eukprot:m.529358 g.529358  ORF g.529358 m.529358 type:complete len:483 (+) comp22017_c1_seq2:275-1723(+)
MANLSGGSSLRYLFLVWIAAAMLLGATVYTLHGSPAKFKVSAKKEADSRMHHSELGSTPDTFDKRWALQEQDTIASSITTSRQSLSTISLIRSKKMQTESTSSVAKDSASMSQANLFLFIAIGVAPKNFERRQALRDTWLQWAGAEDTTIAHRFFTEKPTKGSRGYTEGIIEQLEAEAERFGDMVFQPGASGYGNENGRRALFTIEWALQHYNYAYFLRVDDDGFLCLRQLLVELRMHSKGVGAKKQHTLAGTAITFSPLLHGKYHCHAAKPRMDENYLLMSHDLTSVIHRGFSTGELPFAPKLTFALNLGFLVPLLVDHGGLHVFDDQSRICWPYPNAAPCHAAWEGTLKQKPGPFCDNFIWSHWVKTPEQLSMIYNLQMNNSKADTLHVLWNAHQNKRFAVVDRKAKFLELSALPVCNRYGGFEKGIPFYKNPAAVVGPGWGIPGMRPLDTDVDLRNDITANITRLYAWYHAAAVAPDPD